MLMLDWWGYEIAVTSLILLSLTIDTEGQNAKFTRSKGEEISFQSYKYRKPRRFSLSLPHYWPLRNSASSNRLSMLYSTILGSSFDKISTNLRTNYQIAVSPAAFELTFSCYRIMVMELFWRPHGSFPFSSFRVHGIIPTYPKSSTLITSLQMCRNHDERPVRRRQYLICLFNILETLLAWIKFNDAW